MGSDSQASGSRMPKKARSAGTSAQSSPRARRHQSMTLDGADSGADDAAADAERWAKKREQRKRSKQAKKKQTAALQQAAEEDAGPSTSVFRPMSRSILAGMASLSSGEEDEEEPRHAKATSSHPLRISGDIIIDEVPHPASSGDSIAGSSSKHFEPPGLFSTSLMPSLVAGPSGDVQVALGPSQEISEVHAKSKDVATEETLLLPTNVLLDTSTAAEQAEEARVQIDDADMEGVHFVDEDSAKGATRYFDASEAPDASEDPEAAFLATADQSKICSNCKKPGHRPKDCPHVVCTTCGKMDEHERRDCPFGLICFGCGGNGHRNAECPNRKPGSRTGGGCERCGARDHRQNSCPTIWRVYVYNTPSEREEILREKSYYVNWEKEAAAGDEAEKWCYNCAREGHLGDDCTMMRGSLAKIRTASAFSYEVSSRGPFHSSLASRISTPAGQGKHTRWDDSDLPGLMPEFGGLNAGQKSREKRKRSMAQQEVQDDDEDDQDWFDRKRGVVQRGSRGGPPDGPRSVPRGPSGRGGPGAGYNTPTAGGSSGHPFGHAHLMSPSTPVSAPANLRGQTISFGRLSTPGSGTSTPTNQAGRSRNQGAGGERDGRSRGPNELVSRIFGRPGHESLPARPGSPASSYKGANSPRNSPLSREGTPSSGGGSGTDGGGSSRKKRRRQPEVPERDWENDWRKDDRLGGAVRGWGREMDQEERQAKRAFERDQRGQGRPPNNASSGNGRGGGGGGGGVTAPSLSIKGVSRHPLPAKPSTGQTPSTGQRYYGGY